MPMLEALDYEHFSYNEATEQSLSLDDAVKKAAELRRADPTYCYRISAVDDSFNVFIVKKVPVASVYAEFIARVTKTMGRYLSWSRKK